LPIRQNGRIRKKSEEKEKLSEEKKPEKKVVSRRGFIQGAVAGLVVGAAATYGATTMMQPPTATPKPTAPVEKAPTNGKTVTYNINGEPITIFVQPNWTLLDVIRKEIGLTGTKKGCDYGECGACSVLVNGKHMLACMMLAIEADGKEITTIEGLGKYGALHPLQESFIRNQAFQCGFCTPGMIIAAKALKDEISNPSEDEIRRAISGNLCRCGEYARAVKAIQEA
jgi:aerobic-type carbon monoxide dehydrogenase small subunit (CoxS/CutS family)